MERSDSSEEGDRYFAAVAESYDRLQPLLSPPYEKGLGMIVDLIPFDPEETFAFVDLGCGTAEPAVRVLQHFPHATGTCIDSEPGMLSIASKKLAAFAGRAEVLQRDMTRCEIPGCDVVLSAKAVHHVSPDHLSALLARIRGAIRPGGCFILYDAMSVGPAWGPGARRLASRFRQRHVGRAIAAGIATEEEIELRRDYKQRMKAAGKDVEYEHGAEDLMRRMAEAGFDDMAVAWRMLADTILVVSVKKTGADAEEDLHPGGIETSLRSRSAAKASAARMSARSKSGRSARISASVIPAAKYSRTSYTVILSPRMHGFPRLFPGSSV